MIYQIIRFWSMIETFLESIERCNDIFLNASKVLLLVGDSLLYM